MLVHGRLTRRLSVHQDAPQAPRSPESVGSLLQGAVDFGNSGIALPAPHCRDSCQVCQASAEGPKDPKIGSVGFMYLGTDLLFRYLDPYIGFIPQIRQGARSRDMPSTQRAFCGLNASSRECFQTAIIKIRAKDGTSQNQTTPETAPLPDSCLGAPSPCKQLHRGFEWAQRCHA